MMYKLIGALLLLAASVGYGMIKIREERAAAAETIAAEALIRTIRENIAVFCKPMPEIFASYRDDLLEDRGFLPICREKGICEAWELIPLKLPEKLQDVTKSFVMHVGRGYRDDILRAADFTLAAFTKVIGEMQAERMNREKLYRTIPPLLALSAVLLFL